LNWVAFLYIGTRAKRPSWWLAGAVYATPVVLLAVLSDEALLADVLAVAVLGLASIVHAFLVRGKYIELIQAEQEQKLRKYQSLQELLEQDQEVVATTAAAPGRAGGGSTSTTSAAGKSGGSMSMAPAAKKTGGSASAAPAAGKTGGSMSTASAAGKTGDSANTASAAGKTGDSANVASAVGKTGDSANMASAAGKTVDSANLASADAATGNSVDTAPADLVADSVVSATPASLETTQTSSAEEVPSATAVLDLPVETEDVPAPPTSSKPRTMTQQVDAFVLEDVEDHSRHAAPASRADIQIINLNTASAEEIGSLPGIGLLLGMTAVSIRETKGRFTSLEQFVDVIGLKPHVAERLRPYVIL
jgi:competence ComEA-like helix-hairpin-helix protein